MMRVVERVRGWLGWCPHARPLLPPVQARVLTPADEDVMAPGGGAGGADRGVACGFRLALGSMLHFLKNPRLLLFSVLAGFLLMYGGLFFMVGQVFVTGPAFRAATEILTRILYGQAPDMLPYTGIQNAADLLESITLSFTFSLGMAFCISFLLAGLIACVAAELENRPVTIRAGLGTAWRHVRALLGYSALTGLVATAGMLVLNAITLREYYVPDSGGYSAYHAAMLPLILPGIPPAEVPVTCLRGAVSFSLMLITMYVIPVIILEGKGFADALIKSGSLLRNTWRESLVFVLMLILILLAISVTFEYPWESSPGSAILIIVVWLLSIDIATVMAIMLTGLYRYAATGRIPDGLRVPDGGEPAT